MLQNLIILAISIKLYLRSIPYISQLFIKKIHLVCKIEYFLLETEYVMNFFLLNFPSFKSLGMNMSAGNNALQNPINLLSM